MKIHGENLTVYYEVKEVCFPGGSAGKESACDEGDLGSIPGLGRSPGVGTLSLLQGIFPTQGSNPGLLHCKQILYQLNHKGSPRILE